MKVYKVSWLKKDIVMIVQLVVNIKQGCFNENA